MRPSLVFVHVYFYLKAMKYTHPLLSTFYVSLAFYMLLIFLNSCQKTSKMICDSNFMVLNHFWTFWRKKFSWFLTSEISEICDSGASKIFNSLNFRLARKNFGMVDTGSIFFPYVGDIDLSNAPTLMSIRHLEKKWALKNWNYPPLLIDSK